MKRLALLSSFIFFYSFTLFGQDSLKKTNPIIYGEAGFGFSVTGGGGFQGNVALNYQVKKSLFTVRLTGIDYFSFSTVQTSPFTVLPALKSDGSLTEYGALYGLRFIQYGHSFSFSAGLSLNDRSITTRVNKQSQQAESSYVGLPFEMNVLWFNNSKQKYRIYHIIPVGKPTAFGSSFGFKLSGNVSQHSYVSLGLVFGLGDHKQY